MQTSDSAYRRKPEAGAAFGPCKEGVEDAREIFLVDAATVIGYFNHRLIGRFFVYVFRAPDTDDDLAVTADGFDGIDNKVEHRVFDLRRISGELDVVFGGLKIQSYAVVQAALPVSCAVARLTARCVTCVSEVCSGRWPRGRARSSRARTVASIRST